MGLFWDQFGTILETFWDHFGLHLRCSMFGCSMFDVMFEEQYDLFCSCSAMMCSVFDRRSTRTFVSVRQTMFGNNPVFFPNQACLWGSCFQDREPCGLAGASGSPATHPWFPQEALAVPQLRIRQVPQIYPPANCFCRFSTSKQYEKPNFHFILG